MMRRSISAWFNYQSNRYKYQLTFDPYVRKRRQGVVRKLGSGQL